MSGVKTHTQDPIHPTRAGGVTPNASPTASSVTTNITASARPAATTPLPTAIIASATSSGPPAPQPGAAPVPYSPETTAKPSLPPPPKAGEKPQPAEYYTPMTSTPTQPQIYPSQRSQLPMGSGAIGLPPVSTTQTTTNTSFPASGSPSSLPKSPDTSARASLEHPPGYFQNPYASDLTPDQRFATEIQAKENQPDSIPSLGYNDNARKRANSGFDDESVWDAAMRLGVDGVNWSKEKGKQLGDLHEQVWDSIGRR